jgi:hypothetical protein
MNWRLRAAMAAGAVAVVAAGTSVSCRARPAERTPSVEITNVPPADKGGPDTQEIISGRVVGAPAGYRIVIFSKSRVWWVQPGARNPYTTIAPDATWKNPTHLGTEYAALLVEPSYVPPSSTEVLPAPGAGVVAVTVVPGDASKRPVRHTLQFSGYEWQVRAAPSDRGGVNEYDPANAWTDAQGALHLRIAGTAPDWTCAEIILARRLGYGLYRFVVRDVAHLEPAAVLGFFTFDGYAPDENHREMNIEVSRWGNPAERNARYVVQPYYVTANLARFVAPAGVLTHWLRWEPGRATFRTVRGAGDDPRAPALAEHVFTQGVPAPGGEEIRINLYAFRRGATQLQRGTEVVVEKFAYSP